ncbi:hypothetical protein E4634_17325 [Mangrovimicrobium sediminis]|uniref:TIGR03016 family PEP-CTERM system-associated outer membrane protein n=1 Tax=Mangrovimicrobium sediminis TaxID=2562682 RepID=A0A4Z0LX61_9GAMM|nr:hypothetical protein [Haliea sp. SAOS-164]TGD71871.1 hypothetical protein E4634_17325 [Haliea sp. SAOS-164]
MSYLKTERCPHWQIASALLVVMVSNVASAAETSVKAGASLNYEYNDNVRVSPINQIALSGWTASGSVDMRYATPRFAAEGTLRLNSEKFDSVDTKKLSPGLQEPDPSDFDSDNQALSGTLTYSAERQKYALYGEYSRDSTLNTQFTDTGLGDLATVEGASRRESVTLRPSWRWQMTERQNLSLTYEWQDVEFDSERYSDYDYQSLVSSWAYGLTERVSLQVVPTFSYYESSRVDKVTSTAYGVQAGAVWEYSENLNFTGLIGSTRVETEVDGGFFIIDPETFELIFVEYDDQESTGLTGNLRASYTQERTGISAQLISEYVPSGNGRLREDTQARLKYFWKPLERMRLDFDARYGVSKDTRARGGTETERDYAEAGVRFAYQFAEEWWVSAKYRYRLQDYENSANGSGEGNLFLASVSYRLPKEIL